LSNLVCGTATTTVVVKEKAMLDQFFAWGGASKTMREKK
jgi:hypothetical protein